MAWAGDKGEGLLQLSFWCSFSASAVTDRPSRWPEEVPVDRHKLVRAIPVLPRDKLEPCEDTCRYCPGDSSPGLGL